MPFLCLKFYLFLKKIEGLICGRLKEVWKVWSKWFEGLKSIKRMRTRSLHMRASLATFLKNTCFILGEKFSQFEEESSHDEKRMKKKWWTKIFSSCKKVCKHGLKPVFRREMWKRGLPNVLQRKRGHLMKSQITRLTKSIHHQLCLLSGGPFLLLPGLEKKGWKTRREREISRREKGKRKKTMNQRSNSSLWEIQVPLSLPIKIPFYPYCNNRKEKHLEGI